MKVLKWVAYILGGFVLLMALFLGALYGRYMMESPAIHKTVDSFVNETRSGNSDTLKPLVHPALMDKLIELLQNNGELFSGITKVEEKDKYFSYSWKSGIGETTDYHGIATFDTGETANYDLKLIKLDGSWVVYDVTITPVEGSVTQ